MKLHTAMNKSNFTTAHQKGMILGSALPCTVVVTCKAKKGQLTYTAQRISHETEVPIPGIVEGDITEVPETCDSIDAMDNALTWYFDIARDRWVPGNAGE